MTICHRGETTDTAVQTFAPPDRLLGEKPKTAPRVGERRAFFDGPGRGPALQGELARWPGTRFTRLSLTTCRPGLRANCVAFVHAVLVNTGAIRPITWPAFVVQGGGEPMFQVLCATLDGIPELARVWSRDDKGPGAEDLLQGDVLVISTGRALHHLAIYEGDHTLWHVTEQGGGVCTANLFDPLAQKHARRIYRAFERK